MIADASEALWYFAYGSNMQRATFVQRRGMRPQRSVAGRLLGYRLTFDLPVGPGERGVANHACTTHGVLHLISEAEFATLDRTEGVHSGYYTRVPVMVRESEGRDVEAWTYVSSHGVAGRKPSERYLNLLLEGAREHDLPADYIRALEAFDRAVDERVQAPGEAPKATKA
jgi:cation transport regulator ChaC